MTKFKKNKTDKRGVNKMKYISVFLVLLTGSFAAVLNVGPGQTYSSIQAGIDASTDGDTVLVFPSTYQENITFTGKNITVASRFVLSDSTDYIKSTIIDANQEGSAVVFNNNETSAAKLTGFTIKNGYAFNGGGIYIQNSSPKLEFLVLTDNSAYFTGGGIYCLNSTSAITNVTVVNNSTNDGGGGIAKVNSSITVKNSIFWNNTPNSVGSSSFTVTYSDVEVPADSIYSGTGNINQDPSFDDIDARDYDLQGGSACIDAGDPTSPNDLYGTPMDMGALYFQPTTGCMDPDAYNYDAGAYSDPGNVCEYSPVAGNVTVAVTEDISETVTFSATDANSGDVLSYSILVQPQNGTITIADPNAGTGSYTPNADYFGGDTLQYVVTDDSPYTLKDTAFVYLSITNINDNPVLTPIGNQTMVFNQPLTLTLAATDVDDNTEDLIYNASTTSSFLTLTLEVNSLTITPTEFWGGSGDVTVTVTDQSGAQDSETFTVTHMPTGDFVSLSFGSIDYTNHVIPIMMNNPMPIGGFQFQVSPDIITISGVSGGRAEALGWINNITINNNIVLGYMTVNLPPIPAYQAGDTALTFLSWTQGAWAGGPEICLQDVVLSDTLAQDVVAVIDTCVTYGVAADITQDATVDVLDIVSLVDFVLGNAVPSQFQIWAGDSNEDGALDVVDIVYIVQVILGIITPRQDDLQSATIEFDRGKFLLNASGTVAGMEVNYEGNLRITESYLPENWEIHQAPGKLLIFNFGGENLSDAHLFDFDGQFTITSNMLTDWTGNVVSANVSGLPLTYSLSQAYPNPFNPVTNIGFSIQRDSQLEIVIYDILGNQVDVLYSGYKPAGMYNLTWNASDHPSGVYIVRMVSSDFVQTQKLILLK